MVSLKDIAGLCNVSVATVSKALNDHSDIGQETKQRIKSVAQEMGYVPNAAAKAMKTNRTRNIGVLFMDDALCGLTHDYFSNVLESFKKEVEKSGYDITFISNDRSRFGRTSYLEHARYRRFDGIVIACVKFDDPEVIELAQGNIPVVTIDHIYNDNTSVVSDNVEGITQLVDYVVENGHRKIAYIHGTDSAVTKSRLVAFHKALAKFDIEIPDEYLMESPYRDTDKSYEATKRLLKIKDKPTCIFFPDDYAAYGGLRAITEYGLRVPEDISIVGYDGIEWARNLVPRLTTYRQDTKKIGEAAAKNLIDLIERPKMTLISRVAVKGWMLEGETVSVIR